MKMYRISPRRKVLNCLNKMHGICLFSIFVVVTLIVLPASPLFAKTLYQEDVQYYTIEPGETLSEIAKENGVPLDHLMRLNGITDPDAIIAGQVLYLPVSKANVDDSEAPDGVSTGEPESTPNVASDDEADPLAAPIDESNDDPVAGTPEPTPTTVIEPSLRQSDNPIATLNRIYTVRPGDTLPLIALQNGVNEEALRQINGLIGTPGLVSGQTLTLPATGSDFHVQRSVQEHVVEADDSLSKIARSLGVSLPDLLKVNHISDPNTIQAGDRLVVPGQQVDTEGDPRERPQVGPAQSGFFYYTVRPGDTLSEIARDFDTPMLAILEYNNLPNEETVYAGLELRLPYGPPPLPQDGPPVPISNSSFLVSLSRQQCWVFQGERVRERWNCSTGYGEWITRTGTFQVQTMLETAKSGAYRLDMPYWLGIYDVGEYENGIHGLPVSWETGEKLWDGLIGQPATFGCAMLDDSDAATLFDLAYLGMPVHVVQ
jgi:LysM repeat protein